MYDGTYYELMARYNRWMNGRLYGVCAGIPDEDRKRDVGAFFRSIHGTLNHLLFGDLTWLARFNGEPPKYGIGDEIHFEFDALQKAREAADGEIIRWADALCEEWLNAPFEYTSGVDGKTRVVPAWVLVTHMFNHQTHHRGQLTTLITQLGHDPGITDIPWLPALRAEV